MNLFSRSKAWLRRVLFANEWAGIEARRAFLDGREKQLIAREHVVAAWHADRPMLDPRAREKFSKTDLRDIAAFFDTGPGEKLMEHIEKTLRYYERAAVLGQAPGATSPRTAEERCQRAHGVRDVVVELRTFTAAAPNAANNEPPVEPLPDGLETLRAD